MNKDDADQLKEARAFQRIVNGLGEWLMMKFIEDQHIAPADRLFACWENARPPVEDLIATVRTTLAPGATLDEAAITNSIMRLIIVWYFGRRLGREIHAPDCFGPIRVPHAQPLEVLQMVESMLRREIAGAPAFEATPEQRARFEDIKTVFLTAFPLKPDYTAELITMLETAIEGWESGVQCMIENYNGGPEHYAPELPAFESRLAQIKAGAAPRPDFTDELIEIAEGLGEITICQPINGNDRDKAAILRARLAEIAAALK